MSELKVTFRGVDLQKLARDGLDSMLLPMELEAASLHTLQLVAGGGYRWDPVAPGSAGARVPILAFKPVKPELKSPFLFGEAWRAFFTLHTPVAEIVILFDPNSSNEDVCRMGVMAIGRRG